MYNLQFEIARTKSKYLNLKQKIQQTDHENFGNGQ
jgi:hypothetical protein